MTSTRLATLLIVGLLFLNPLRSQDHWETAIFAGDNWSYIIPSTEPSSDWNTVNFDDADWSVGPGGFGYGDNDDGTTINSGTISVFMRRPFSITELTKLNKAILHADYDDGFVAFFNGVEVFRSSNLMDEDDTVPFDATTNIDHEAQLYTGLIPEAFVMDSIDIAQLLSAGENMLAIQVHNVGETSSDMSSNFFFTFGITDESTFYDTPPDWFQPPVTFTESNLPIFIIDTFGEEIPDDPRIPAHLGIIDNSIGLNHINDPFTDYDGAITIERRGNSSQGQPKKPYRFETVDALGDNNNVSLLGMPEENDWVLYAPWSDKTLIRNVLTYQLSNEMGWYASRTRHCELYLNGDYKGIYVLMEKIKRDQNRVNISKLDPDEVEGDDLTGGYILKFDWIWTGDNLGWFESDEGSLYNYHYPKPDEISSEQVDYIQQYINNFENMMMSNAYNEPQGYPLWINIDSFIDYIMLQELSKNVDAYRLSTYIYKDKHETDHRLYAGPIWDINHGFGNCDYGYTWLTNNWLLGYQATDDPIAFWWHKLWNDDGFEDAFSQRYTELRSTTLSLNHIYSIIDSVANYLGPAIDRNFTRWPTLGTYVWPNYYVFDTYEEEIEYLKSWTAERLQWMDQEMLSTADVSFTPKEYRLYDAFPNPFNPTTTLRYDLPKNSMVTITIYDMLGNRVKTLANGIQEAGNTSIIWNGRDDDGELVSTGVYIYKIQSGIFSQTKKMVLLK
jgi:hypothetical protein